MIILVKYVSHIVGWQCRILYYEAAILRGLDIICAQLWMLLWHMLCIIYEYEGRPSGVVRSVRQSDMRDECDDTQPDARVTERRSRQRRSDSKQGTRQVEVEDRGWRAGL